MLLLDQFLIQPQAGGLPQKGSHMAQKQRVSRVGTFLTVEYPTISKTFKVDVSKYPTEMREIAEMHGWGQKFGDAKSGKSAEEKYAEVQAIHSAILQGQWERTAHPDLTPIICEAVARLQKVPLSKVEASAKKKPEQVEEWKVHPEVKVEIAKIRAERAAEAAQNAEKIEIKIA
jgi:hypothetical protein